MSKKEKLIARFIDRPRDFSWDELRTLLRIFGFLEMRPGKTGGSRRKFHHSQGYVLSFHKPHPGNIVKHYVLDETLAKLAEWDLLK